MKKTITTERVLEIYQVLRDAKFNRVDADDQITLVQIQLVLEPIAKEFEKKTKTASDKLKESFPGIDEKLRKAEQYRQMLRDQNAKAEDFPMGASEYYAFINGDWAEFQRRVNASLKECSEKEEAIDFKPISIEALQKLIQSNSSFTIGQTSILYAITETK
jgi:hypothetical protein